MLPRQQPAKAVFDTQPNAHIPHLGATCTVPAMPLLPGTAWRAIIIPRTHAPARIRRAPAPRRWGWCAQTAPREAHGRERQPAECPQETWMETARPAPVAAPCYPSSHAVRIGRRDTTHALGECPIASTQCKRDQPQTNPLKYVVLYISICVCVCMCVVCVVWVCLCVSL